jgi:hypothetical protein
MNHKTEQVQSNIATREGLRNVLLTQYACHEANHHPELAGGATERVPTVPKAHTLADIYKCLHQGEFGVGHSIEDPTTFARRLAFELLEAEPNSTEPLLENVSSSGSVFRVNLRPYRRRFAGRDEWASSLLVQICLDSAVVHKGSDKDFIASLAWFRELNNSGELAIQGRCYMFPGELVDLFLRQVNDFIKKAESIPVLSHSPVYKKYNAPSYRVVDRASLEGSALAFLLEEAQ